MATHKLRHPKKELLSRSILPQLVPTMMPKKVSGTFLSVMRTVTQLLSNSLTDFIPYIKLPAGKDMNLLMILVFRFQKMKKLIRL